MTRSPVRGWSRDSPRRPAAQPAGEELILSDKRETVLRSIVLPQLLSLYHAARPSVSFNGIDSEPFAAALNGWFFNDRAINLTMVGVIGAINELVNVVCIFGSHRKYGSTLMAEKNRIDTNDREDACNDDLRVWLWDLPRADK